MMDASGQALLTCDAVARDPVGKVTLYGVFDRIYSTKFPTVHPLFSIFWRCFVPGPGQVHVAIIKPDGSTLLELEPVETGEGKPHPLQGTYTLGGFEFPMEGDYSLVLKYNGKELIHSRLSTVKRNDN